MNVVGCANSCAYVAAIPMPAGFFFSVTSPTAKDPNALIYLVYFGAAVLAIGVLILGVGLVRKARATIPQSA
jgi:hypothetical protein